MSDVEKTDPLAYFVNSYISPLRKVGMEHLSLWVEVGRDHHSLCPLTLSIMVG